jgi:hypothetical protein
MDLTDRDLAHVRDYVGTTPDDSALYTLADEATWWQQIALRVLMRRRADATAGGQQTTSFSLEGVLSVGMSKADLAGLDALITDLQAQIAALTGTPTGATVRVMRRPDRPR